MQKKIKFIISLYLAIQINGFILGIFFSNQACREGVMPFSEVIKRDEPDKIALLSSILVYPGFKLGTTVINSFRKCGRVLVKRSAK